MSMGGYFAPRAAAFEDRIDGVIAWDSCFDFAAAAEPLIRLSMNPVASNNPDVAWAINNARWTLGVTDIDAMRKAVEPFRLAPVASRIRQDVLILAATEDHFVPFAQTAAFEKSLVNAKSVKTVIFDRASGGAEHCQTGNSTLVHETVFDWMQSKFGENAAA
jgi:dienelactone hydrolase